jgi:hypothetical protein
MSWNVSVLPVCNVTWASGFCWSRTNVILVFMPLREVANHLGSSCSNAEEHTGFLKIRKCLSTLGEVVSLMYHGALSNLILCRLCRTLSTKPPIWWVTGTVSLWVEWMYCLGEEWLVLYRHFPTHLHGMMLNTVQEQLCFYLFPFIREFIAESLMFLLSPVQLGSGRENRLNVLQSVRKQTISEFRFLFQSLYFT